MDIAKIESNTFYLNKEIFDLKGLIQELIDDYNIENNIESKLDNDKYRELNFSLFDDTNSEEEEIARKEQKSDLFLVNADKSRISQVISNLLNNAMKFTSKGDTINIKIKKENINGIEEIIVNIMVEVLELIQRYFQDFLQSLLQIYIKVEQGWAFIYLKLL